MKNAWDMSLSEVRVLFYMRQESGNVSTVENLVEQIQTIQNEQRRYEVKKVEEIRARDRETGTVQKSPRSLDRDLIEHCILVRE